ncbi:cyclic nucleotide-binding domain-containing protein [bacterium]|nr:cyclic nucleotide-binding domain-containing protein [bacterium]
MVTADDLSDIWFFQGLSEKHKEKIGALCEPIEYKATQVIFREYTPAQQVFIQKSGRIAITIDVGNERTALVGTITSGRMFGWSALVPPNQWTATASAIENSVVYRIDGEALRKMMEEDTELGYQFMRRLVAVVSGRLKDTRLQLISLMNWPRD